MNRRWVAWLGALLCPGCVGGGVGVARVTESAEWTTVDGPAAVCDSSREVYAVSEASGEPRVVRGRLVAGALVEDASTEPIPGRSPAYFMRLSSGRIFVGDSAFERLPDGSVGAFLGRGIEGRPLDDTHLLAGTEAAPELYDVTDFEAPQLIATLLVRDDASTGRPPHGIRDFAIQGDRLALLSEDHRVIHTMALSDLLSLTPGEGRVILNDRFVVTTARSATAHWSVHAIPGGRFLSPFDNPFVFSGTRPPPNPDMSRAMHSVLDGTTGELLVDGPEDIGCPARGECLPNLDNGGELHWVARGDFVFVMEPQTLDVFSTSVIDIDAWVAGTPRRVRDWLRDPDGVRVGPTPLRQICAAPGERVGLAFAHDVRSRRTALSRFVVP
jgi:hypothetical protein